MGSIDQDHLAPPETLLPREKVALRAGVSVGRPAWVLLSKGADGYSWIDCCGDGLLNGWVDGKGKENLSHRSIDRLIGWLVGWLDGGWVRGMVGGWVGWLAGWLLVGWFVGWLPGCLPGKLAGWRVGWWVRGWAS